MKKLNIFIAHHSCNICYQHITPGQELATFFYAEFLDVIAKGHAGFLLEAAADVGCVVVLLCTKILMNPDLNHLAEKVKRLLLLELSTRMLLL